MHPIRLNRVTFGYNRTQVFTDLTVEFAGGATTAIAGPNGSGKSTLLGLIAGLLRPQHGSVDLAGADDIALAVQRDQVAQTFPITVGEVVAMGRWRRLGLLRRPTRADRDIVDYWIDELALDGLRHRRLGELSGGQRQRTLLAQAFAQQAPMLLLDEPTAGLDADSAETVYRHLQRLAASGTTVVAATHDPDAHARFDHQIDLTAFAAAIGSGCASTCLQPRRTAGRLPGHNRAP
ncbi:ATP-binding cassette domain-containing protein [Mycolicibacterium wolinskyi]|uniref:ABC transporter n=1 Tax=Mycolicibacterium wolinskyi TaxID=59750 RepID=A0A1X2FHW6_9MYCO|nr:MULTISPECIES: zinc ABC transporter ATP-binding protein AztA [Mycolicibacterium]MCV7290172.1 ATP-binding cassette domain-containing protein [Mycolicibacterium wolinskyi]MCV7292884.1 ATP-binding cassette domain-containing protein [Mycolicibacterium goodii]ORX18043.1 ABC transporter [Mycolicibacterium wolinskyi]